MVFDISEAANVFVYSDGVFIANATDISIEQSRNTTKTDVLSTKDKRISNGSTSVSGSLTELKTNDVGVKLVRSSTQRNVDFQSKVWDGVGDVDTGTAAIQATLNSGTTSWEQEFTALGTRLEHVYLLAAKSDGFDDDLTVQVKTLADANVGSSFEISADLFRGSKTWVERNLSESEKVTLTEGTQYKLVITHAATVGQIDLYGNDKQVRYLVGTGDGIETTFTLAHDTVDSTTLFVRLGDEDYLGQLEGYTFSDGTGGGGEDEIVFTTAPGNGVEVYAAYEYDDNSLVAWRLGFGNATDPTYTIKVDFQDEDGNLIDSLTITDVRFSSNGRSVSPASFVERTLQFEGETLDPITI